MVPTTSPPKVTFPISIPGSVNITGVFLTKLSVEVTVILSLRTTVALAVVVIKVYIPSSHAYPPDIYANTFVTGKLSALSIGL